MVDEAVGTANHDKKLQQLKKDAEEVNQTAENRYQEAKQSGDWFPMKINGNISFLGDLNVITDDEDEHKLAEQGFIIFFLSLPYSLKFSIEGTVRVNNLPDDIRMQELWDLFQRFGPINRIILTKDKTKSTSKAFPLIQFDQKEDAQKAIEHLSGFIYNQVILNVERAEFVYSKPFFFVFSFVFFLAKPQNQ